MRFKVWQGALILAAAMVLLASILIGNKAAHVPASGFSVSATYAQAEPLVPTDGDFPSPQEFAEEDRERQARAFLNVVSSWELWVVVLLLIAIGVGAHIFLSRVPNQAAVGVIRTMRAGAFVVAAVLTLYILGVALAEAEFFRSRWTRADAVQRIEPASRKFREHLP